jgi:hypothetical protein
MSAIDIRFCVGACLLFSERDDSQTRDFFEMTPIERGDFITLLNCGNPDQKIINGNRYSFCRLASV